MGNLMGKSEPKSRITEQDRAVLGLKQQRDKLNQYKKRIEGNLDKERQVAKELLKHNKRDKARTLLKKKRYTALSNHVGLDVTQTFVKNSLKNTQEKANLH